MWIKKFLDGPLGLLLSGFGLIVFAHNLWTGTLDRTEILIATTVFGALGIMNLVLGVVKVSTGLAKER